MVEYAPSAIGYVSAAHELSKHCGASDFFCCFLNVPRLNPGNFVQTRFLLSEFVHEYANNLRSVMSLIAKKMLLLAVAPALVTLAVGCKKVDDASKDTMSSGSSGVMSNSAGPSGTAGTSDAAKRASDSGVSASSTTTSEPAISTTPDSTASGASSAQ
ncbi:hypothetical protein P3T18_000534 [Paraburkholderia sp. GAS199]|uniref:hypothetical protein n=1 Tax=Paraburkholderia sp. GAS199 TaxID=3035126 RepID=UPI003D1ACA27